MPRTRSSYLPGFRREAQGVHWETFLHLEQEDFEADKEKMLVLFEEISRLEEECGYFPTAQKDE